MSGRGLAARGGGPLPLVALASGIALSALAAWHLRGEARREAELQFQREASDAKHLIERRVLSYVEVIHGLRALFAARDGLGRVEFHRYVESLDLARDFPGFEVLNYAVQVPAADRASFEAGVRRDRSLEPAGYPHFAVKPPGERPGYHVLVYLEPMQGNEAAFGLDIAANPAIQQAVAAGRDTGAPTASGRLVLTKGDPGLAMRVAVYQSGMPLETVAQRRAAYVGSVGAGFNVRRLMRGAFGARSPEYLRFQLHDVGPAGADRSAATIAAPAPLFDSAGLDSGAPPPSSVAVPERPTFAATLAMEVGGRLWELRFQAPRDQVLGGRARALPWLILAGGCVASLVLSSLLGSVLSSRRRALAMAEELGRRSAELEKAVADLESFSYSVSHDLRAPLRHVSGYAALLRESWHERDAAGAERHLSAISAAASKMGALIDALLGLARTGRAPLRLAPVDLGALVEEVRRESLREAGTRRVEWRIAPLPQVQADAALLRVVFTNLIANALKFSAGRDPAIVEVASEARSAGQALVSVRDNGAGFDMRFAGKLFGVFQRLHSEGEFPGTGIGLATVRRIVERHGGRVWAEAAPDQGATFYLLLRTAAPAAD